MDIPPGDRVQCVRDEYLIGILRGKECPLWVVWRTLDKTSYANMQLESTFAAHRILISDNLQKSLVRCIEVVLIPQFTESRSHLLEFLLSRPYPPRASNEVH